MPYNGTGCTRCWLWVKETARWVLIAALMGLVSWLGWLDMRDEEEDADCRILMAAHYKECQMRNEKPLR